MNDLIKAYQDFINEAKTQGTSFEEFASVRLAGASKITEAAKQKGGAAMLTYQHFVVKLPYYKKASAGKFDPKSMQNELTGLIRELSTGAKRPIKMGQTEFQRLVGKIEVIGELLIRLEDK